MMFFTEVRLQAVVACRAWISGSGCLSATQWETARDDLPFVRREFERARLRVSEALSVEGIDPLGFARRLLIHESAAPLSRAALREVGFVHLESASGIHLYALWRAYEFALARLTARMRWDVRVIAFLRTSVPAALGFGVWGLTGFRPGFLRPLVLVAARFVSSRVGLRWHRFAPIFIALGFDAILGFAFSFGSDRPFADWAPGELHYAGAWWGGILGYEWARARGYGAFRAHLALSIASWVTVLPLDLMEGRFAPATPFLSWITVEFLARGGYPLLFLGTLFVGFGEAPAAREGLQWAVAILSRGLQFALGALLEIGGIRGIPQDWGIGLAAMLAIGIGLFLGRRSEIQQRSLKSSLK